MISNQSVIEMQNVLQRRLQQRFPDIQVYQGYSKNQYFGILEKPILCLLVKQITVEKLGFGNYVGTFLEQGNWQHWSGDSGMIEFQFQLYFANTQHYLDANQIFLELCQELSQITEWEFQNYTCGELEFIKQIQCFRLLITAQAKVLLTNLETYAPITEIELQTNVVV